MTPRGGSPPAHAPERLPWTGVDEADRLIAADPVALLIGFCLDQQVTVQKAFLGPLAIRERLGTLDPAALATMDAARVSEAFSRPPAIHRFPRAMAERVQALCRVLTEERAGDVSSLWRDARDAADLERRLRTLPGIGPMKSRSIVGVLAKQFGVRPQGWEAVAPAWTTLADVDTPERLATYQAQKRAHKAAMRAAAAGRDAR